MRAFFDIVLDTVVKMKNAKEYSNLIAKSPGKPFLANAISRIDFRQRIGFLVSVTRSGWAANRFALAGPARVRVERTDVFRPEKSGFAILAIDSGGIFPAPDADSAALVLAVSVDTLAFCLNLFEFF